MRELAGHQGVGESLPHAAVRRSKLKCFLLALQGFPLTNPFPVKVAGPIVGLSLVTQDKISETVGAVPQISARRSSPKQFLVAIVLKPKGMSERFVWCRFFACTCLFRGVGSDRKLVSRR